MATKKSESPQSLGRNLNFATGRMNALCQQQLDPYDLSLPQWVILSCLWREGELSVGALSGMIGTGLPATSRIIDRMVDRGLIERHKDETDGRIMRIRPTEQGQGLNHLASFHEEINSILLDGFSDQERVMIFDLLIRLEQNAASALR